MGGLKDDIASEIQMFKPKTLSEAIELARIRYESVDGQRQKNKADQPQTNKAALSEQCQSNQHTWTNKSNKQNCMYKKQILGRKCKGKGRKGYASIAMRNSHQDIAMQLHKPLSLKFVHIKNS